MGEFLSIIHIILGLKILEIPDVKREILFHFAKFFRKLRRRKPVGKHMIGSNSCL